MTSFSEASARRRATNARSMAAFGPETTLSTTGSIYQTIRPGNGTTLFTIGYERRDGEGLIAHLVDAGIQVLADVRERPMSRRPDFRRAALEAQCLEAGIRYESWTSLGSTKHQRDALRDTGDLSEFRRRFRDFARRRRSDSIARLAKSAKTRTTALICYERCHNECHRSVLADLIAEKINATIVAIL